MASSHEQKQIVVESSNSVQQGRHNIIHRRIVLFWSDPCTNWERIGTHTSVDMLSSLSHQDHNIIDEALNDASWIEDIKPPLSIAALSSRFLDTIDLLQ